MKASWQEMPIGDFLIPAREAVTIEDEGLYNQITVSMHGRGVRLRRSVLGKVIKTKNQFLAKAGRFIYSRIDARHGAMGVVPDELDGAVITGDFPTFDFNLVQVEPRYFEYMTKTALFEEMCAAPSKGVTNRKRLKESELLGFRVLLPSLPEQRRIVIKLDKIVARVAEAKRLAGQIEEEQTALLLKRVAELANDAPRATMAEVAPVVRRPVTIDPDTWYSELGIRSFGKGLFEKPKVQGRKWTWQRPYWMGAGNLLFSNIKAWEGAVAIIPKSFDGYVGSHRYITCRVDPKRATPAFLAQWFLSPEGLAKLGGCSPGATDRNRTLGLKKLETIEVPLPTIEQQQEFGELLRKVKRARTIHQQTAASLEAFMPALLDQAFRGEL